MILHNKYDKETLRKKLEAEPFKRVTLSFYRYVYINDPAIFRDEMYKSFEELGVLGRTYIAAEGVNSQISVPENNFEQFRALVDADKYLSGVPFKIGVEDDGKSFYKLIVRVKNKIVADGQADDKYDVTNVGKHLTAQEFNEALDKPETIVIDMRNHYESEVGRFEGALCPDADTFRDALTEGVKMVEDKKDHKILLYCTGGIRCEKASAWFKHHGFEDVNQLHGGIIEYARQVKQEGLQQKFIGKNFVFDDRLGERITEEVISTCHQCDAICDNHVNCANDDCHLLFIQCENCATKYDHCCSPECIEIYHLPVESQRKLRKGKQKEYAQAVYKSRLRPNLKDIISEKEKGTIN